MHIKTPPMGWNTWNTFGQDINESLVMESADKMVEKGYKDAGYEYVVIDDCWSLKQRDENGCLVPDPKKFPHGMKYLADYVHSKGLKFGMYSCAGYHTCAGYPSSYGYEFKDAATFASWGVDFLKYDFCYFPETGDGKLAYLTMANALRASGRDILFSACNWGTDNCWEWMNSVGAHMYRSTGDIFDVFESVKNIFLGQVHTGLAMNGAGCFNDLDMLVCGMYGKGNVGKENACGDTEYKTHFALWCLASSPLMMGGDIRALSDYCHDLMTNPRLIAIDQDPDARPPFEIKTNYWNSGSMKKYIKLLSDGDYIVGIFNFGDGECWNSLYEQEIGFPVGCGVKLHMTDVFTGEDKGYLKDAYNVTLAPHDCTMLRLHIERA